MKSLASPIKEKIISDLEALIDDGILGEVDSIEWTKPDVYSMDIAKFPVAIIGPGEVKSDAADNQNNIRTYQFQVFIMQKAENMTGDSDVEDVLDAILNALDTDFTAGGTAVGGILPVESVTGKVISGDKVYICTSILVNAKAIYQLGD